MVYDISTTSVTDLARNKNLINMLIDNKTVERVKGIDSVKTAIEYLDEIYTTTKSFELRMKGKKNGKENKAVEIIPPINDGAFCQDCHSLNLSPTGSCRVCLDCGASQGCS